MKRASIPATMLAVLALVGMTGAAQAANFDLEPASLEFATTAGPCFPNCDYEWVTVTNNKNKPIAISLPFGPSDPHFWDTQAGSCWQTYEVFGLPIPANGSCTLQVGFASESAGTFTGTLTITRCDTWHTATPGFLECDSLANSQTVQLTGVASSPA